MKDNFLEQLARASRKTVKQVQAELIKNDKLHKELYSEKILTRKVQQ